MFGLRFKLWLGLGGLLLILLLASTISIAVLIQYSHTLERIFHENYDSIVYCNAMKEAVGQLDARAASLAFDRFELAGTIDPDAVRHAFDFNLDKELHNTTVPGEPEAAAHLAASWSDYSAHYHQFESLASGEVKQQCYESDLLPRSQKLQQLAQQISNMNLNNMVSVDGRVKRTLSAVRNTLILLAACATLLAIIISVAAGAAVLRPLRSLTQSAGQIAGGNLDLKVNVRSEDEIGQLAAAFNQMAEKLREFRQRDRDRLLRTQETTQVTIDSVPDPVAVLDREGKIETVNRAGREMLKLSTDPATPPPAWLMSLHRQAIDTGAAIEPQGYQSAVQLFERGEERFFLPLAVPMRTAVGQVGGVTVVLADVTALKKVDEAKSDLLATVSHELRTPLTSLRMAAHMLADDGFGPLTERQAELVQTTRENSDRLYRIVENLLSISRIEAGKAALQLSPRSVGDVVAISTESLRQTIADRDIAFAVDSDCNDAPVNVDMTCIGYALSNLLTNAIKFTPPGGSVRVQVRREEKTIRFDVIDSGVGIAADDLPRIFNKFYRVDSAQGGAGLGLAIAKEVVEAHGGTMHAQSTPGQGSCIGFTLPVV